MLALAVPLPITMHRFAITVFIFEDGFSFTTWRNGKRTTIHCCLDGEMWGWVLNGGSDGIVGFVEVLCCRATVQLGILQANCSALQLYSLLSSCEWHFIQHCIDVTRIVQYLILHNTYQVEVGNCFSVLSMYKAPQSASMAVIKAPINGHFWHNTFSPQRPS